MRAIHATKKGKKTNAKECKVKQREAKRSKGKLTFEKEMWEM